MRFLLALFICFAIVAPEVQGWVRVRRTVQRVTTSISRTVQRLRQKYYVTATGTVRCKVDNQYRPLPCIKIELLDDELVGNTKMAEGRANDNGEFSLTGNAREIFSKPDPKIKVIYEYDGTYGTMCIRNWLGLTRDHYTNKRSYLPHVHFGNIDIDDEHCRAYYRFYNCSLKDYYTTVGSKPPYGTLYVTTRAVIAGLAGSAYAEHTKIRLPHSVDPISCETAKHEFAHTIRHHYDGSYLHFLWDVGRFRYTRNHKCPYETNSGFAFNEGWAHFWADECTSYTGSNYRIEGNVAAALKRLENKSCTNRAKMVDVLKYNRGNIHSFCDFNYRHGLRFPGCNLTLPKCSCMSKSIERLCKRGNWPWG